MHSTRFILAGLVLSALALAPAPEAAGQGAGPPATGMPHRPEAGPVLTLEQAIDRALAANPDLRSRALDMAIANGARRQAALLPNPALSFVKEGTQRGSRVRTIELSQVIETGGKRHARIALAEHDSQLAAGAIDVVRTRLRADVTAAYFDALGAQERLHLARTSLDIATKAGAAAAKRVAAGRVSPIEASRADVAQATSRLELAQAEAELAVARETLAAWWGETGPGAWTLAEPVPELAPLASLQVLFERLGDGPQLRQARLRVRREEAQMALDRSARMPDLTLTLGRKKEDDIGHTQTVLGVSLPLPLFDRNQGKLQESLGRVEKARAELDAERIQLRAGLSAVYRRIELGREQLRSMREEVLPAAQSVFGAAVTGFEAGKFDFLDVLDAQRTLMQTRTRYIQVRYDLYRSIADLGRFVDTYAPLHLANRKVP